MGSFLARPFPNFSRNAMKIKGLILSGDGRLGSHQPPICGLLCQQGQSINRPAAAATRATGVVKAVNWRL
jgi:hypothetical protein